MMDPLLTRVLKKDEGPPPVPKRLSRFSDKISYDIMENVHLIFHRAWNVNVDDTAVGIRHKSAYIS